MKKTFIFIVLVLMGVSGFVYASNQSTEVLIGEGWNLVYGFTGPDRIESGSEIGEENIKATYLLMQPSQEYIRLYPNPESDKLEGIQDSYYEQTAQWVYSDKEGMMKYDAEEPLPLGENKLFEGWNLVKVTQTMFYEKEGQEVFSWGAVKGDCNIEKIYAWNYETQDWMPTLLNLESVDFNDFYNMGMVVKVSSDCNLSESGGNTDAPPGLPNEGVEINKEECENQGDRWDIRPLMDEYFCNEKTSDVGQECLNSSECEGRCMANLTDQQVEQAQKGEIVYIVGMCSEYKHPRSEMNYQSVYNGEISGISLN